MTLDNLYNIRWKTKRSEDQFLSIINELNYDVLGMTVSSMANNKIDELITKRQKLNEFRFDNSIIKTPSGNNSHASIEGTAALLYNSSNPFFVIPDDLLDYIRKEIPDEFELHRYVKNFPRDKEIFDNGKIIFDELIKAEYPPQAAYSLTGATFTECAWNPNVYNKAEKDKESGSSVYAQGWANCGEGLFGLTNWSEKEKIIKKLNLHVQADMYGFKDGKIIKGLKPAANGVQLDMNKYNEGPKPDNALLFQCTESVWIQIMKEYIKGLGKGKGDDKTTQDYLMYDGKPIKKSRNENNDDHKLLYASYLFKAGNSYQKTFEKTVECIESYKKTHIKLYGKKNFNYKPKNGFVEQLLIAYLLSQYIHNVEISKLSLKSIFKTFGDLYLGNGTSSQVNTIVYQEDKNTVQIEDNTDYTVDGTWWNCVEKMGKWYEKNIHTYQGVSTNIKGQGKHYYTCKLINKSVADDCSGFIKACLQFFGLSELDPVTVVTATMQPDGTFDKILLRNGFTRFNYSFENLQVGDIICGGAATHTEIYAGNNKSYSWGNIHDGIIARNCRKPQGMPCYMSKGTQYKYIWRYTGKEDTKTA